MVALHGGWKWADWLGCVIAPVLESLNGVSADARVCVFVTATRSEVFGKSAGLQAWIVDDIQCGRDPQEHHAQLKSQGARHGKFKWLSTGIGRKSTLSESMFD